MRKIALVLALAALSLGAASPRSKQRVVHAGTMIDGTGAMPRHQVSIIIEGERIVAVRPGFVSSGDDPRQTMMKDDEIDAVVDTAPSPG